jgi:ATP-dependent DNA helicase DinG
VADLRRIHAWAGRTQRGDIAEIPDVPESSLIWPRVTSTVDNCLGQDCPQFDDCFLVKARREALAADVLVINHHLFCADLALKETAGFAELLPKAEAFILDEAHQLPEIASHFFGQVAERSAVERTGAGYGGGTIAGGGGFRRSAAPGRGIGAAIPALRQALGAADRRALWREIADQPAVVEAVSQLTEVLDRLREALKEAAQRGKGLENCHRRGEDLAQRLVDADRSEQQPGSGALV